MGSDLAADKSVDRLAGSGSAVEVDPNQDQTAGDCPSTGEPELPRLRRNLLERQDQDLTLRQAVAVRYFGVGTLPPAESLGPEIDFGHPRDAPGAYCPAAEDTARAEVGPFADSRIETARPVGPVKELYTRPAFQASRVGTKRASYPQMEYISVHGPVSARILVKGFR
jgi:hypothetical protein